MQISKVDQDSFKLITECLSDVDGVSRNQVLFSEKLSNCLLEFIMANDRKYEKQFFEKMLERHISFNFLKSKVSDLAIYYQ